MLILSKNQRNVNEAVWRQFTYSERTKKKLNANIQCWRSCPDIDSCIHLQPYRSHPLGRNVTIKNLFLRNNLAKAEQSLLISLTSTHWNAQGSALQVWLFSTHVHCLEDLPLNPGHAPQESPGREQTRRDISLPGSEMKMRVRWILKAVQGLWTQLKEQWRQEEPAKSQRDT